MKKSMKLLMLLLALVLSFSLFACGGGGDDDGEDDTPPDATPASDVELITDGVANFRIVLGDKIPTDVRMAIDRDIVQVLKKKHQIEVVSAQQGSSTDKIEDVEVLIGDVTNRGDEYIFDRYQFGKEGYMIKIIGTKIVIQAGSDEMLLEAVMEFAEDVLEIESDYIESITMLAGDKSDKEKPGNEVFYIQDDYKIDSLSVGSTDMKDYTIAADTASKYYKAVATSIQDTIYGKTGYFFPIVKPAEASDKSIVIQHVDKKTVSGKDSFTIKTEGTKLVISCAYDNMLEECVGEFLSQYIILKSGDVSFSGTVAEKDISFVTYEDFGAEGDGKTNDYQAFYDAHVFANECGQTVKADSSKTYLLSDPTVTLSSGTVALSSIPIQTNVEWGNAKIIIDDSNLNYHDAKTQKMTQTWVFSVNHDDPVVTLTSTNAKVKALGKVGYTYETSKIDLGLGYPAMLIIYNENHEVYRRSGSTYDGSGSAQHEVIVIDEDGNIDESTPFMFDYEEITKIQIYNIDIDPITISGGIVTTKAPQYDARIQVEEVNPQTGVLEQVEKDAGYYARGLKISRSFTTVDGLKHYVENEVTLEQYFKNHTQGAVYNGFFNAANANDILIKNCVMTGRRYYHTHGTYEFSANCVNKIVLENCDQHNFWVDENGEPSDEITGRTSMDRVYSKDLFGETIRGEDGSDGVQYCWGLGGTNFCKNMHYIDSRLSRFDAHCGLYDGSIEGCEISFFEIIGKGTFKVIDTDYYSNGSQQLVYLRGDYGCTWEGDFIIEDVRCYVDPGKQFSVFLHSFNNWYYGYKCYIPSADIKDIAVYNYQTFDGESFQMFGPDYQYLYMYTSISDKYMHKNYTSTGKENNNPIGVPEYLRVSSNANGYMFKLPYDSDPEAFLAGVDFYSGDTKVEYKQGNQGCFTFY